MKPKSFRRTSLVAALALLIAACNMPTPPVETPAPPQETPAPPTETATPPPNDPGTIAVYCQEWSARGKDNQAATPEPPQSTAEQVGLSYEELPRMVYPPFQDLMYVEGQVLLTGNQEDIEAVTKEFGLELSAGETKPIPLAEGRAIHLAQIMDGRSVEEVACLFNQFAAANPGLDAAADPNYFVSPAWRGGGSPWTQNGFWAANLPGGGLGRTGAAQFSDQWALGKEGIGLFQEGARAAESTGEGVIIGVLDTAPWTRPCLTGYPCSRDVSWKTLDADTPANQVSGTPDMTVWEFAPANPATCPGPDRWDEKLDRETQNINNHGLFVASLAHTVAPQSKIHLLRVLEDDGCGDLFKVLQGLQHFQDYVLASAGRPAGDPMPLTNTVVNLSLGVHQPYDTDRYALPPQVTALQSKVQELMGLGAVVVAAAGNDSFSADPAATSPADANAPGEAEIPARDADVIAVAASTIEQGRSCFSNIGDVAAPGGNGLTLSQVPADPTLAAEAAAGDYVNCIVPGQVDPNSRDFWCTTPGNEAYCLVGLGINPATRQPGYLFWNGTSFATPLVSGIAALKLQEGVAPADVDDTIYASVDPATAGTPFLGAGVANVSN